MVKNILTIVWNNRQKIVWIYFEQVLVFIVLMLSSVSLARVADQYYTPGLVKSDDLVFFGYVVSASANYHGGNFLDIANEMDAVLARLEKDPSVIAFTEGFNTVPYMRPTEYYFKDSVVLNDKKYLVQQMGSDVRGVEVFDLDLEEGTWLPAGMLEDNYFPAVITRQLADLAGWEKGESVGKKIEVSRVEKYIVVGVVSGIKYTPLEKSQPGLFTLNTMFGTRRSQYREFCARVKPGMKDDFINAYGREFRRGISDKNTKLIVGDLEESSRAMMSSVRQNLILQITPTLFLFLFSFLGTFGLFWLYTQKRVSEFALRRAIGSTKTKLVALVVAESMLITLLASVPGLLLSLFIYDLTPVHLVAIGITLGIMLLFSVFSAWYPAYKASKMDPAAALHYE